MTKHPKVSIRETKRGFVFQVVAANGEPMCTSEPYQTRANAKRGALDLFDACMELNDEHQFGNRIFVTAK